LKSLVLLVAGAEQGASEILMGAQAPPVRPDSKLDVTPAAAWPARTRCDVAVIGSGAGGATAARTLARAGLDTVVIEEGRAFSVEEFRSRHPLERFGDLYQDAGATIALGRPPVYLPIGRGVGGTTLVNSGTCYRTPRSVLERWRDHAGLAVADPDAFASCLDEAWKTLGVEPVSAEVMGRNGELALAGAKALGWRASPLMHNAYRCAGCCQSPIGCPRNAKSGVHLNVLPEACESGARIISEARVERIVHEDGGAVGLAMRRRDGSPMMIRTPCVVVAAGATETPPLLRRSGLGGHPHIGRNLSIHPALAVLGRFPEPVRAWDGVLQSAGIEEFHERDRILIEATSAPFGMGWTTLPGVGRRLLRELEDVDGIASLGAMIGDRAAGRVLGRRLASVRYNLHREDAARLLRALGVMGRALFAAGAHELLTGIHGAEVVRSEEALHEAVGAADPRRLHLAAFHPTGTARAGADPERFPVDTTGRLREVAGVWVADASILPSCPEVNPQITIMALALAVSEGIVADG
jgi:choline dehydrogenase-like flavoprotein